MYLRMFQNIHLWILLCVYFYVGKLYYFSRNCKLGVCALFFLELFYLHDLLSSNNMYYRLLKITPHESSYYTGNFSIFSFLPDTVGCQGSENNFHYYFRCWRTGERETPHNSRPPPLYIFLPNIYKFYLQSIYNYLQNINYKYNYKHIYYIWPLTNTLTTHAIMFYFSVTWAWAMGCVYIYLHSRSYQ